MSALNFGTAINSQRPVFANGISPERKWSLHDSADAQSCFSTSAFTDYTASAGYALSSGSTFRIQQKAISTTAPDGQTGVDLGCQRQPVDAGSGNAGADWRNWAAGSGWADLYGRHGPDAFRHSVFGRRAAGLERVQFQPHSVRDQYWQRSGCLRHQASNSGVQGTNTNNGNFGTLGDVNGNGVSGTTTTGNGVSGTNTSQNDYGTLGDVNGYGVYGNSKSGTGVGGFNTTNGNLGTLGDTTGYGVYGTSSTNYGVYGKSTSSQDGVYGSSNTGSGVTGINTTNGNLGSLGNTNGFGVYGTTTGGNFPYGVYGVNHSSGNGDNGFLGGVEPISGRSFLRVPLVMTLLGLGSASTAALTVGMANSVLVSMA